MLSSPSTAVAVLAVGGIAGLAGGLLVLLLPARAWAALRPAHTRWAQQIPISGALLFGGLGLLGSALLLLSAGDLWQGWRSSRWQPVEARIDSSRRVELMQMRSSLPAYRAEIRYRYRVDGREYSGSRLAFGDLASSRREAVEQELHSRFAPGALLQIHVDPRNPAESVLEPGVQAKAGILSALGAVFLGLSAWQLRLLARDWSGDGPTKRSKKSRRRP